MARSRTGAAASRWTRCITVTEQFGLRNQTALSVLADHPQQIWERTGVQVITLSWDSSVRAPIRRRRIWRALDRLRHGLEGLPGRGGEEGTVLTVSVGTPTERPWSREETVTAPTAITAIALMVAATI